MSVADGKSITDPRSVLERVAFLTNESVSKELRLDASQQSEIKLILDECKGQPNVVIFPARSGKIPISQRIRSLSEEIEAKAIVIRLERESRIKDILDPKQLDRLEQLVYQIEMSRVGLRDALLDGFLGERSGIEDFEKPALAIVFDAIQREFDHAKLKIVESSEKEILGFLTGEQRRICQVVLGKPFDMQEQAVDVLLRKSRENLFGIVPNPDSLVASITVLQNPQVAQEIKLSDEQSRLLRPIIKSPLPFNNLEAQTVDENRIEKILRIDQRSRLKEIVYRLEVIRRGLGQAIANGFLGRILEVTRLQRDEMLKNLPEIESKTAAESKKLLDATRIRMLNQLSVGQRDTVKSLVGKPFDLHE